MVKIFIKIRTLLRVLSSFRLLALVAAFTDITIVGTLITTTAIKNKIWTFNLNMSFLIAI